MRSRFSRGVATWRFDADEASLYGALFVAPLSAPSVSAFIAEGSEIQVRKKTAGGTEVLRRYFRVTSSRRTNGRMPPWR